MTIDKWVKTLLSNPEKVAFALWYLLRRNLSAVFTTCFQILYVPRISNCILNVFCSCRKNVESFNFWLLIWLGTCLLLKQTGWFPLPNSEWLYEVFFFFIGGTKWRLEMKLKTLNPLVCSCNTHTARIAAKLTSLTLSLCLHIHTYFFLYVCCEHCEYVHNVNWFLQLINII